MIKIAKKRRSLVHQYKEPGNPNPYRSSAKPKGTSPCQDCGATMKKGRWVPVTEKVNIKNVKASESKLVRSNTRCPACQQGKDRYALGVIEIHGDKSKRNKEDILGTVLRTERIARSRNDQERILWTKDTDGILKIYVTLPELARHIGRELEKAFKGIAEYSRSTEEPYLRVRWWSDAPAIGHEQGAPLILKRKKSKLGPPRNDRSRAFRGRGGT